MLLIKHGKILLEYKNEFFEAKNHFKVLYGL
jgi:hypothetical protein